MPITASNSGQNAGPMYFFFPANLEFEDFFFSKSHSYIFFYYTSIELPGLS